MAKDITKKGLTRRDRRLTLAFREPKLIDRPCDNKCGRTRRVSTDVGPIICGDCIREMRKR